MIRMNRVTVLLFFKIYLSQRRMEPGNPWSAQAFLTPFSFSPVGPPTHIFCIFLYQKMSPSCRFGHYFALSSRKYLLRFQSYGTSTVAGSCRRRLGGFAPHAPNVSRPKGKVSRQCYTHAIENQRTQPQPSRPPRFYVSKEKLPGIPAGTLLYLPQDEARHATRVLRLQKGDVLELCDGKGGLAPAEIVLADKTGTAVCVTAPGRLDQQEPERWEWTVAVACGSLKGGRGDWLVEKCSELGATTLLPLLTERSPGLGGGYGGPRTEASSESERTPKKRRGDTWQRQAASAETEASSVTGREARWQRVAAAATKQSLRSRSLILASPCDVEDLCRGVLDGADVAFVGVEGAPPIHTVSTARLQINKSRGDHPVEEQGEERVRRGLHGVCIIGPEGDFTIEELERLRAAGALAVGMGPLRLRAETAAIAMLSYVTMAFERSDGG
jgi:16S rRNA (uracil1498-N3)-methyltransferase